MIFLMIKKALKAAPPSLSSLLSPPLPFFPPFFKNDLNTSYSKPNTGQILNNVQQKKNAVTWVVFAV